MVRTILILCAAVFVLAQSTQVAAGTTPVRKEARKTVYSVAKTVKSEKVRKKKKVKATKSSSKLTCKKTSQESGIGNFSAYTSRKKECGNNPYITADGTDLRKVSYCVVANNRFAFGTVIDIEGIGLCVVKDRMGRGGPDKFDLRMHSVKSAREFGRRRLRYKIVKN